MRVAISRILFFVALISSAAVSQPGIAGECIDENKAIAMKAVQLSEAVGMKEKYRADYAKEDDAATKNEIQEALAEVEKYINATVRALTKLGDDYRVKCPTA